MSKLSTFLVSLIAAIQSLAIQPRALAQNSEPRASRPGVGRSLAVVGYLPDYRLEGFKLDVSAVTDLIYFGISAPKNSKECQSLISTPVLNQLSQLKTKNKCRLWMCVGGWEKSAGYSEFTASADESDRVAQALVAFAQQHDFDGIDFDWEHPHGATEMSNYVRFLQQVRARAKPHNLKTSIAIAGWMDLSAAAYQAVDRVHLMSYDHDFPQASQEKAEADIKRVVNQGCPIEIVCLGVPFYGRNKNGDAKSYQELRTSAANDAQDIILDYALNSPDTLRRKVAWAKQKGLGGIMIWELGQDAVQSDAASTGLLLKTIREAIQR